MPHHHAKGGGSWISFRSLRIRNLNVIKAVATLDAKPRLDLDAPHPPGFLLEFSDPPDDREKLRRLRISKANKGNTPWNKGRKHTPGTFYSFLFFSFLLIFIFSLSMSPPETLQKIKERTRLAMQNPKVMSCKNILMSLFNNILSILIQYHFHLLLFTISKHSISL